jgi:ribonuclease J
MIKQKSSDSSKDSRDKHHGASAHQPVAHSQNHNQGVQSLRQSQGPQNITTQINNGLQANNEAAQNGLATTSKFTSSRQSLRVIPMGGVEEVGENMTVFEYGDDIIIIDMGLAFPDESMPGIDYIIPDTKWLEENKPRIREVIITHGHLDHNGGIPYILPKLGDPPIYTMPLTAGFIKKRMEEFNLLQRTKIHTFKKDDILKLGNFSIRFFRINHNIPDGVGLAITTPVGMVVYATDWKFDHTPVDDRPTEFDKIAKYGSEGVLMLMSDSTNATKPGYSTSERELSETIDRIFTEAQGRIIFATFSTLISRIQQVFNSAAKYNRKVVVVGRSMVNNIEIALSLGYLKIQPKIVIKTEQSKKYPDKGVVILTTGSQGEEAAALARIARGEHKTIKVKKGDTVVVSSSPIPGNERAIANVLSNLTREGAKVLYYQNLDIHSSGHAKQEDLKLMISLTKPKYFMPIHGEHFMLVAHADLAKTLGIQENNIFILDNGQAVELNSQQLAKQIDPHIPTGYLFIDGLGVGDVGEVVIRDRQVMAKDGMFVIIMTVDRKTGKLINQPDIISRGFIYMKGSDELIREVKHEVRKLVESKGKGEANYTYIRQIVRDQVGEYLYQKTERRPMILPVILEV